MHPKSKGSNCSQKFCDLSIRQKSFCYKRFSELRHKRKKGCGLNLALEKYVSKSSHPEPILPFWKCRLKVQACNWYFNAGGVRQKTVFLSVHYRRLKKNVASISVWFQNIKKKPEEKSGAFYDLGKLLIQDKVWTLERAEKYVGNSLFLYSSVIREKVVFMFCSYTEDE